MTQWLLMTLGVGALSALVPVVNMELYLVGLLATQPHLPWPLLGLAAAVGQMAGKLVYFYAGRGGSLLGNRVRRNTERKWTRRWADLLQRFKDNCRQRPWWAGGVLLVSATSGLPPFAIIAVLAGTGGVGLLLFSWTGLLGRSVRFGAVAAAPGVLAYL